MPYIKENWKRKKIDKYIDDLIPYIESKGDVNYTICELIGTLILKRGIGYTTISELIDVLPDAEAELRRRLLEKYEDYKIIENGDVPSFITILKLMKKQEEA